ncbi:MAG: LPS export ABC transporter permease LptG [Xanthomonadaceae bacterium]|nr:LPS export ABC transporter permease LptG [Xanthomonadaceae bacterium]
MLWKQHAPRRSARVNRVPYASGTADSRAERHRPEPASNSAVAARVAPGVDGAGQPEALDVVSDSSTSQGRRPGKVRPSRFRSGGFTLKRVDYLVALSVIGAVLTTWLVLTGFQAVTQLLRQLVRIGKNGYTLNDAFFYVLLTLPRRAYEMFGNSALVGGLMALGGLASTGEVTALRALGMSRLRIAASVAGAVALLLAGVVVIGETAAPWGDQQAQAMDLRMSAGSLGITSSGLWARDGNTVINARRTLLKEQAGVSRVELGDVRLFTLTAAGQLSRFEWARRAEYDHAQWMLQDVRSTTLDPQGVHTTLMSRQPWHSNLDPKVLAQSAIKPEHLSIRDLQRNIGYLRANGESPGSYEVALWARAFYPVNVLVLVLCAMPFAFGTLRSGGLGKRIFIGMLLAVGWYFLQRVIVNFAIIYGIAPMLANLLPAPIVSLFAWWYFRRTA